MSVITIAQKHNHIIKLDKARELLPLIIKITKYYSERVNRLIENLENIDIEDVEFANTLEDQLNSSIRTWYQKMNRLGTKPKGLWIIEFDFGSGYLCWKYPEEDILYWHSYNCGYKERILIENQKHFL
ncbi:MAG: DUF2203 family protein [Bdellovibrionaceae bacterium]|jgi:hypothetical protein|nr:DUF2203 family protein [Pseudobdellovibrionaceae bacterium]